MKHEHLKCFKRIFLEEPKTRRDYGYKIITSVILTFIFLICIPRIPTGTVYGTYTPKTDVIWINPELEGIDREIVVAHEEMHRVFYRALTPSFIYVEVICSTFVIFLLILGTLILSKRLWYLASLLAFIAVMSEVHAYGYTLLRFGIHDLTVGTFIFVSLPLLLASFAKVWFEPYVAKPRVIGYTPFEGVERSEVCFIFFSLILVYFCWGILVCYFMFGGYSVFAFSSVAALLLLQTCIVRRWKKLGIGLARKVTER